jgi:hypothetical protein
MNNNLMKCPKCKAERVSLSGLTLTPYVCRECAHPFANGITPILPVVELEVVSAAVTVIPSGRVSKTKGTLNFPSVPFSQKDLAAFNGIENYKEVYSRLHAAVDNKTLTLAGMRENKTRGKDTQLYAVAAVVASLPVVAAEA